MAERKSRGAVRNLVMAALFIALDIVFTRLFSVTVPGVDRFSLQFLSYVICGYLLGPWWGMGTAIAGDLLGSMVSTGGMAFLPGFTVTAALRGWLYGIFLHNRKLSAARCLATEAAVNLVSLFLNSFWLALYNGSGFWAMVIARFPARLIFIPVAGYLAFCVLKALGRAWRPFAQPKTEL